MKTKLTQRLRRQLRTVCNADKKHFLQLPKAVSIPNKNGQLIHIDNDASILGVAHLDTVLTTPVKMQGDHIECGQLDDRLGVWVLLYLLPHLQCQPFDILLTDNEERGQSTASEYIPDKKYNWVFEFDRMGIDTVCYEYEDDNLSDLLWQAGFDMGYGSYTDICDLEHLGCKAFNIGVGYHKQHTPACFANLADTVAMARLFKRFTDQYHNVHLPHTPNAYPTIDHDDICPHCNDIVENYWSYCPWCGTRLDLFDTYYPTKSYPVQWSTYRED